VLALIDHELRFLSGRMKLRDVLRRGDVGKVRHVKVNFRADSRADVNRQWDWWSDKAKGGGVLGAIASHVVDGFRWLLGAEVSEVFCNLATHVRERKDKSGAMKEVTTDDEANLILRFADGELTKGATGNVSMSMVEPGEPEHRLEIFGARGAFMIDDDGELWQSHAGDGEWKKVKTDRGELAKGMRDSGWARGFTAFSRQIVAALRDGRNTVEGAATFDDGFRTQLVLDAARKSHESGCWAKIE